MHTFLVKAYGGKGYEVGKLMSEPYGYSFFFSIRNSSISPGVLCSCEFPVKSKKKGSLSHDVQKHKCVAVKPKVHDTRSDFFDKTWKRDMHRNRSEGQYERMELEEQLKSDCLYSDHEDLDRLFKPNALDEMLEAEERCMQKMKREGAKLDEKETWYYPLFKTFKFCFTEKNYKILGLDTRNKNTNFDLLKVEFDESFGEFKFEEVSFCIIKYMRDLMGK